MNTDYDDGEAMFVLARVQALAPSWLLVTRLGTSDVISRDKQAQMPTAGKH